MFTQDMRAKTRLATHLLNPSDRVLGGRAARDWGRSYAAKSLEPMQQPAERR